MLAYWDADLCCRFANRAYQRWFGVDPEALLGTSIRDLLGPQLFAQNEPYIRAVLAGREQTFERVVPGPGGIGRHSLARYVPDIVADRVVGFIVEVTETTELKSVEAALRVEIAARERSSELLARSEAALRHAQHLGDLGSWEWEVGPDITIWSAELYRIFGFDPARLPPSFAEHHDLYAAESWLRLRQAVDRALRFGEPYCLELEYRGKGGVQGWLESRGEAVRGEDGSVICLRGTAQVITERRAHQQSRLERDLAIAVQRDRDLLLARVSERMRSALNEVLGSALELSTSLDSTTPQGRAVEHVLQGGRQIQNLLLALEAPDSHPASRSLREGFPGRGTTPGTYPDG